MLMEDLNTKNRFQKGSAEAKEFMSTLRSKRGGKITPIPIAPAEPKTPKLKTKKDIIVDFS